ncbi:GNAT family N-acetyltransferase [Solibacillus sp. CAU 1738]|uniref:GNAT family N-acetyltransferase n=1 Tax=Solibacillus sp. CAU 1738 TaxID=3140363 RepID=UPI003261007C
MYWCKIAATEKEFDAIAALNYETFVEEIPQHTANKTRRLVDKFHGENTYLVVYKEQQIIGMLALRDKRPFSIDDKIGSVEKYLSAEDCKKLCEVRLLAVKKLYRNGRVFLRLAQALVTYLFERKYTACVISGTTRQEKLYKQMGFKQFANAVGTEQAMFLPMVLTRTNSTPLRKRLARNDLTFYPGPVLQEQPLLQTNLSHRSFRFKLLFEELQSRLLKLSHANYVTTLVGTGTLANEAMLAQLKSDFQVGKGLIITNGEFGKRLEKQATYQQLSFDTLEFDWYEVINVARVEQVLQQGDYRWLLYVHGETSTGMYNDEHLAELGARYNVAVCADCISSFGALPFSLAPFYLATAVSGKAVGALSGLAFVFSSDLPRNSNAPLYLNLAYYSDNQIPFTLPAALIENTLTALANYPERFNVLAQRFNSVISSSLYKGHARQINHYPMIVSLQIPSVLKNFSADLKLNGIYLHDDSVYLQERKIIQLSVIQPNFEEAFKRLLEIYSYYNSI